MKVLVCGSRGFRDYELVHAALATLDESEITVIHGGARGADTLAGKAALFLGYAIQVFPALWNRHGKKAGFIRNQQMLDEGKPDLVFAFYYGDTPTPGTADMIQRAQKAGVRVLAWPTY